MPDSENANPPLTEYLRKENFGFTETLVVLVGEDLTRFTVPCPDIIRKHSPFFEAACARWKKGDEPITLIDETPRAFEAYLQLIYFKKMPPVETPHDSPFSLMVETYICADRLLDSLAANQIIDDIEWSSEQMSAVPKASVYRSVWAATPENSPLRRLLLDYLVYEIKGEDFDYLLDRLPHDVSLTVAKELKRGLVETCNMVRLRQSRNGMSHCLYHQHDDRCPPCK